ncbi:type IV toxin-antitoxin system AbiEi family antitoxin domain-containing protein [Oryzihumus sp.]|uniref:type IV toxin-antitoxin system AbiEi family antitoxin domain-containing protein n=1 Tax=Oryzihumus sp. TaxID=1968903 RepID=UPI002EDA7C4F
MSHRELARERAERLARSQGDAVSRRQCLTLGMTPRQVEWLVASGRWRMVFRGVYITHMGPVEWLTRASAALLACGDGAALSHASAARVNGLTDRDPPGVEVLLPAHRRVVGRWAVVAALSRRGRHRWGALLGLALVDVADGAESVLELRYVTGVERSHGLPAAARQRNSMRAGRRWRDDNAYEQQRVLVELDGRLGHVGEGAFRDRSRDNGALLDGWVTLRFGWQDVTQRPCLVAADVATVLRDRGWTGRLRRCGPRCKLDAAAWVKT